MSMRKKAGFVIVALAALAGWAAEPVTKVPAFKWFDGVKGYAQALELQKETGADLFVYFAQYQPSDQAGLCRWFERKGLQHPLIVGALSGHIRVKITLPLSPKESAVVEPFRANKCPAVFIVDTNGWRTRCAVFEWTDHRPELLKPESLKELFLNKSAKKPPAAGE